MLGKGPRDRDALQGASGCSGGNKMQGVAWEKKQSGKKWVKKGSGKMQCKKKIAKKNLLDFYIRNHLSDKPKQNRIPVENKC